MKCNCAIQLAIESKCLKPALILSKMMLLSGSVPDESKGLCTPEGVEDPCIYKLCMTGAIKRPFWFNTGVLDDNK